MRPSKALFLSIVAGVTMFTSVLGIAASLNVSTADVSAGTASVAACDTNGVSTAYTVSYATAAAGYVVSTVSVSGIATPGCDGRTMKVTLIGAGDASLAEQTVTLATPAEDPTEFDFGASGVAAAALAKIAVVIY